MADVKTAASRKWRKAFEIIIQRSIETRRVKGKNGRARLQRSVKLSEQEEMDMFNFYRQYVKDDRAMAVQAIGLAAREAVRTPPIVSCAIFLFFLVFILLTIFKTLWYPVLALLIAALVIYLLDARRRRATMVWITRKQVKDEEMSTIERMCVILDSSPFRCANYTVVGGLLAAIAVALYYSVGVSIFG